MRYGTDTQKLTTEEVRCLFERKNRIIFEEKENTNFNYTIDFNVEAYTNFIKLSGITTELSDIQVLENIGLVKNGVFNNAGVLFFCKNVYKFFKNATVQVFLYKGGSEFDILDSKEFKEDLFSNFKQTFEYLELKLNTEYVIKDVFRENVLELPKVALREALLNAFSHRDYNSNFNIQVHIYSNRVEIINAGGLLDNLKIEDLGIKRFPRNVLLCDMFQRMELVEEAGSGIKRIKHLMEERDLRVDFEVDDVYFKVVFHRNVGSNDANVGNNDPKMSSNEPKNDPKMSSNEPKNDPKMSSNTLKKPNKKQRKDLILRRLEENKHKVSYYLLLEEFGVARSAIKRDLNELKEEGLIEFVGDKRTGVWRLKR
ncbi:MAG: HTH domain-containing protein [Nanoarchaeota archaeon]|nr:HTH domain-containing protein [Nanoarchaeota archaeon]